MNSGLYFDVNGSTPVDPLVRDAFLEALEACPGNPAAGHPAGRASRERVEGARRRIAEALGVEPEGVVFNSGGTEANNHVVATAGVGRAGAHLLSTRIEHKSILRSLEARADRGDRVTWLDVDREGRVDPEAVRSALLPETVLVTVMAANNETGVIQPTRAIGEVCREARVLFHSDAVAGLGKMPVAPSELGCDLVSLSGHKMYAPKGCGILVVRPGVDLAPLMHGCGQQGGRRSGTENPAAAVALARAFERLAEGAFGTPESLGALRDRLWEGIRGIPRGDGRSGQIRRNGGGEILPNTLNVCFPGHGALELLEELGRSGVSVSAGAAAGGGSPSHVLTAMGLDEDQARSSLRFSLGAHTTADDVDTLVRLLEGALLPASA